MKIGEEARTRWNLAEPLKRKLADFIKEKKREGTEIYKQK